MPDTWKRDGGFVYSLTQTGWRRGEPVMENAMTIRVEAGKLATQADAEKLAERICQFLNADPTSEPAA